MPKSNLDTYHLNFKYKKFRMSLQNKSKTMKIFIGK